MEGSKWLAYCGVLETAHDTKCSGLSGHILGILACTNQGFIGKGLLIGSELLERSKVLIRYAVLLAIAPLERSVALGVLSGVES